MKARFWLINHMRAFLSSLGEVCHAPLGNLLTFIVIAIAMTLPACLFTVLQGLKPFEQQLYQSPNISLYLKQNITNTNVQTLQNDLKSNPLIQTVRYISPEQGLTDLSAQQSLGDTGSLLQDNPIPGVMIITPYPHQRPKQLQQLLHTLDQLPLVDVSQLNMTWVKRLYSILQLGEKLAWLLGFLFSLGVVLIIANTIRLTIHHKHQEITLMKLMGAKLSFIRRPLLYRGFWFGFFGGLIACVFVYCSLSILTQPLNNLIKSYDAVFNLPSINLRACLYIIIICALLGIVGSFLTSIRQLYQREQI